MAEKTNKNLIISILGGRPVADPKPMTAPKYIMIWKKIKRILISRYFLNVFKSPPPFSFHYVNNSLLCKLLIHVCPDFFNHYQLTLSSSQNTVK